MAGLDQDHPADVHQPGGSAHAHFPAFDGLRALAATSVAVFHAAFLSGYTARAGWAPLLTHGDVGVTIFFLISGFLLYRPMVAAHVDGRRPMGAGPFLWRRFLRIYPAYWFTFLAILLTFGFQKGTPSDTRSSVIYLLLLQIYDFRCVGGGITQTWTLGTEVSFYAFLPLYTRVIRGAAARVRASPVAVEAAGVGALILTSFLWRTGWVLYVRHAPPTSAFMASGVSVLAQFAWLPSFLDLFGLGMGLAVASAWSARTGESGSGAGAARTVQRAIMMVRDHPAWCWAIAAGCYWVTCFHMGLLVFPVGFRKMLGQTCYGLVALFLLLPAVFPSYGSSMVDRVLRARPVAFLGLVSYGIYLWHQAWIAQAFPWLGILPFRGKLGRVFAVAFPLTVGAAAVNYYLVERPAMRRRDLVLGRGRVAPRSL